MKLTSIFLLTLLAACSQAPKPPDPSKADRYPIRGEVLRCDATHSLVTIKHEKIEANGKVWMEAMTMDFPVPAKADYDKACAAKTIRATLYHDPKELQYWVAGVE
jgi:Cu/Ag efflux protein CusF